MTTRRRRGDSSTYEGFGMHIARTFTNHGQAAREEQVAAQYDREEAAVNYAAGYAGRGCSTRYYHSRQYAVTQALADMRGGKLLDVGCGPGMFISHLLRTRPGDFRVTAYDRSTAMAQEVRRRVGSASDVQVQVGRAEDMPFPDDAFDVVVAMGVLEYTHAYTALCEIARVTRPGGRVLVTMLNPLSPFRLTEWLAYWPLARLLGRMERLVGGPERVRHGASRTGIRALPSTRLRRLMRHAGLVPQGVVYYDVTPLVPPLDKLARRWSRSWLTHPERTVRRTPPLRWLGTAYLVSAEVPAEPSSEKVSVRGANVTR